MRQGKIHALAAAIAAGAAVGIVHAGSVTVSTSGGPADTWDWEVNDPEFGTYVVSVTAPGYTGPHDGNFYYRNPSVNDPSNATMTWTVSGLDPEAYIAGFSLVTTRITPTVGSGGGWDYDLTLSGVDESSTVVTDEASLLGPTVTVTPPLAISGDFGNGPVFTLDIVQNDSGSRTIGVRDFIITALPIGIPLSNWSLDGDGMWSAADNWSGGVPNVAGAVAVFGPVITEGRTVTVDEGVTVANVTFNNVNAYAIDGPGGIAIDGAAGQINVQAGSHSISTALDLQVDTTVTVGPSAATLEVSNLVETDVAITKSGGGTLQVNNVRSSSLAIDGGTVRVEMDGGVSVVSGLSMGSNGRLDLTNNELRVTGGDLEAINDMVISGMAEGAWNGPGINSSAAAGETDRALGLGQDGGDVVVKFTYAGDATLDDSVTIADLGVLAANWQGSEKYWFEGDFNFDGSVTIADLGILAANWQKGTAGGGMVFEEAMAMFDVFDGVVVPEPAAVSLIGLSALRMLRRRRP